MTFNAVFFLLISSFILNCIGHVKYDCVVKIKKLESPQPLFLVEHKNRMMPYNKDGEMEFKLGEKVELFCQTSYTSYKELENRTGLVTATCFNGTDFKINHEVYNLLKVTCVNHTTSTAKSNDKFTLSNPDHLRNTSRLIRTEIGFEVNTSRWVKQMEILFDYDKQVPLYVRHELKPGIEFRSSTTRPEFRRTIFHRNETLSIYRHSTMDRGHLAAKSEFVYGAEQRATFSFLNIAPQYKSCNSGNWATAGHKLSNIVHRSELEVVCYTGVYGTHWYLGGHISVPRLFFRVIYHELTQAAVVLVTVNNPQFQPNGNDTDEYILCNLSYNQTWLEWKATDSSIGYSYACTFKDFREKVTYLPNLNVSSLLTFN